MMSSAPHMTTFETRHATDSDAAVNRFIVHEAQLQDEHRYDDWEALWADEGIYWVPANADDSDVSARVSLIYDNRTRLRSRIRQLKSGRRHSQSPPSRLSRVLTLTDVACGDGVVEAHANFMLLEARLGKRHLWSGCTHYVLRPGGPSGFQILLKKVMLVDCDMPIPTLSFLI